MFQQAFRDTRVLVTGHTGFKGSWLTTWLLELGAEVAGYSIGLPTDPAAFSILGLEQRIVHYLGDIRDAEALTKAVDDFRPQVVIHMAAQALVRKSYENPLETFEVNTLGTVNLLEAVRTRPWIDAAVVITSDKCYRNVEWVWGYREDDRLGGHDPYSGSKGAAEMAFHSYARSYFRKEDTTRMASARAGNVIGGGDWAPDRIVPDCVRAWSDGQAVEIRNTAATRPWQHVLEPLSGYLWLAAGLLARREMLHGESYNFGPRASVVQSVGELVAEMNRYWSAAEWSTNQDGDLGKPEAGLLKLSCDKALLHMEWEAAFEFKDTVRHTSEWYRAYYEGANDMAALTRRQIVQYQERAAERRITWALT